MHSCCIVFLFTGVCNISNCFSNNLRAFRVNENSSQLMNTCSVLYTHWSRFSSSASYKYVLSLVSFKENDVYLCSVIKRNIVFRSYMISNHAVTLSNNFNIFINGYVSGDSSREKQDFGVNMSQHKVLKS